MGGTGSYPLVGGAGSCPFGVQGRVRGGCFLGTCLFKETLSSLSVDEWCCVPPLLVIWPEASQHWSLQTVGWGQVLVREWLLSGGLMPMTTCQNCCCQCPSPCSEPQPLPSSTGDPPILAGKSGLVSYEVTTFSPGCWCTQDHVLHPPIVEFLFPLILWNSYDQTLLAFKVRFSGGSSSPCQTPRFGSLTWGSALSLLWEKFCSIIFFQLVSDPPGIYGI